MRRNKCKDCREWKKDEGVCDLHYNVHSPGKKRDCIKFEQRKVQENRVPVFRVPWMSRWDKRKLRLREENDRKKRQDMQNLLDQEKLLETPIEIKQEPKIKVRTKKLVDVKKPPFWKKMFRQKIF